MAGNCQKWPELSKIAGKLLEVAKMAGNGGKQLCFELLKIVGNCCKCIKWLEMADQAENCWKWLKMAENGQNGWTYLEVLEKCRKWLDMAGMSGVAGNGLNSRN